MCVVCYSCVVVVVVVDFPFIFLFASLSVGSLSKCAYRDIDFCECAGKKCKTLNRTNYWTHIAIKHLCKHQLIVYIHLVFDMFFFYSVVPPYASHPNCPLLRTITIWCDIFLCNVLVFRVLFFNNMMSSTSKSQLCMIQLKLTGRSEKRHCYECIFVCIYSYNIFNNLTI